MLNEFSCCSFYDFCNYGRNECYFKDTEPEIKERCRCYKLKHSQSVDLTCNAKKEQNKNEGETFNKEMVQLSLFE